MSCILLRNVSFGVCQMSHLMKISWFWNCQNSWWSIWWVSLRLVVRNYWRGGKNLDPYLCLISWRILPRIIRLTSIRRPLLGKHRSRTILRYLGRLILMAGLTDWVGQITRKSFMRDSSSRTSGTASGGPFSSPVNITSVFGKMTSSTAPARVSRGRRHQAMKTKVTRWRTAKRKLKSESGRMTCLFLSSTHEPTSNQSNTGPKNQPKTGITPI